MAEATPYSRLTSEDQAALSVWIGGYDQTPPGTAESTFKRLVEEAPSRLRAALVAELLPVFIDLERANRGVMPTLHELKLRFPELGADLAAAYDWLPNAYRLPTEILGYRVLRVVGDGGQALVLRAQDDVHSAVAVKLSSGPEHNELLLRERRLLGECSHAGLPEVIASGVEEGRAYFLMPFLRGTTLADRYSCHRPEPSAAARIASQLCEVVAHLHVHGVLHRDIKPSNVWLDDQGGVKLIDLGMAIDRRQWVGSQHTLREFHGTPAFMAPEQAQANPNYNGELSDQFSIGATYYWMLTGSPPFAGDTPAKVLDAAKVGDVDDRPLSRQSRRARGVAMRSLAANPGDRYRSVADLAADLRSLAVTETRSATRWARVFALATAVVGVALYLLPLLRSSDGLGGAVSPTQEADARDNGHPMPFTALKVEAWPNVRESPPAEDWILRTAAANGIDFQAIQPTDFTLGVTTALRRTVPWGEEPTSSSRHVAIAEVGYSARIEPIAEAIQYRVGERPWRRLKTGEMPGTSAGTLSSNDLAGDGKFQVRIGGLSTPVYAGPFSYSSHLSHEAKLDQRRFREELVADARSKPAMLPSGDGWVVSEEFLSRYGPVIREIRLSPTITEPMQVVYRHSGGDDLESGVKRVGSLLGVLATVPDPLRNQSTLWLEIDFTNGRFLGPQRYRLPDPGDKRAAADARKTLSKLPSKLPAGRFMRYEMAVYPFAFIHRALDSIEVGPGPKNFPISLPVIDEPDERSLKAMLQNAPPERRVAPTLAGIAPYRIPAAYYFDGKPLASFVVPPVWKTAYVRGRFRDGTLTAVYRVDNETPKHGYEIDFVRAPRSVPASSAYFCSEYSDELANSVPDWVREALPPAELNVYSKSKVEFYVTMPPGGVYYQPCREVSPPSPPGRTPKYIDYEIPYLDRYGRLFGTATFRHHTADMQNLFAQQVAERSQSRSHRARQKP